MIIYLNLHETKISKSRFYMGISLFIFSIIFLIINFFDFNWIYFFQGFIFAIMGITHVIESKGKSILDFFGKRYLKIDQELIELKFYIIKEPQIIHWKDITDIQFSTSNIKIFLKNSETVKIEYGLFTYKTVQKIKDALQKNAENKNIVLK